jgi:plasmid stabilization system protein ParE
MNRLVYTESARRDLLEAWLYIAEINLTAADGVLDKIDSESQSLITQPLMGRARSELGKGVRS